MRRADVPYDFCVLWVCLGGDYRHTPMDDLPSTGVADATAHRLWLLVPSFVLGPETWRGVSKVLAMLHQSSVIPNPTPSTPRSEDHITPWLEEVLSVMPDPDPAVPVVAVGHSASCPRMPLVADALIQRGHLVETMILVNGRFPENQVAPTDRDFPLRNTLDQLVRPDDYLPPWHRWWGPMVEDMLPNDEARARVFSEARPVARDIFEQAIPAPKLPGDVGLAFLAMGDMYQPSYDQARNENWAVARIDGEHLGMVVEPVLVAGALISLVGQAAVKRLS